MEEKLRRLISEKKAKIKRFIKLGVELKAQYCCCTDGHNGVP